MIIYDILEVAGNFPSFLNITSHTHTTLWLELIEESTHRAAFHDFIPYCEVAATFSLFSNIPHTDKTKDQMTHHTGRHEAGMMSIITGIFTFISVLSNAPHLGRVCGFIHSLMHLTFIHILMYLYCSVLQRENTCMGRYSSLCVLVVSLEVLKFFKILFLRELG